MFSNVTRVRAYVFAAAVLLAIGLCAWFGVRASPFLAGSRFTFRVIDAATGAPIERFGIAIEHLSAERHSSIALAIGHLSPGTHFWGGFWRAPELEEHPGGEVERKALPGEQEVGIVAPGYAPLQVPVAPDSLAWWRQTLRLARGGVISARVTASGAATANAEIFLTGDRVKVDPSLPDEAIEELDENKQLDVSELAGRDQRFATDAEGAFRIDGLAPGTYRLTIVDRSAARRELKGIAVAAAKTNNLGVIDLEPAGTIHGRVVLGPASSVEGLRVLLDRSLERTTSVSALDGSFSFESVEPGEHVVMLLPDPPRLLEGVRRSITVAPARSTDVIFDLAANAPCNVELGVFQDGRIVAGVAARWIVEAGTQAGETGDLGTSDNQGIVRGSCPSGVDVRFQVLSSAELRLGQSPKSHLLTAGGSFSERLDLEVGTLVLMLPSRLEIPETGYVEIDLETGGTEDEGGQYMKCHTPGSPDQKPGSPLWKDHRLELGEIAVGEYQGTVSKYRSRKRGGPNNSSWQYIAIGRAFEGNIKVEKGKPTIIQVP